VDEGVQRIVSDLMQRQAVKPGFLAAVRTEAQSGHEWALAILADRDIGAGAVHTLTREAGDSIVGVVGRFVDKLACGPPHASRSILDGLGRYRDVASRRLNPGDSTPAPRLAPTSALAWVLVAAWLGASVGAFWLLERREFQPFPQAGAARFDTKDRAAIEAWFLRLSAAAPPPVGPARATLVHLYNPQCRCNAATEPHLERLMRDYRSRGVRIVAALNPTAANVVAPLPGRDLPVDMPVVAVAGSKLQGVESAPAAFIFDANGRLIYFGPYSDSAWCGRGTGLVEPILDRLLADRPAMPSLPVGRGCFCDW
jgi:hypothetical protein